VRPRRREEQAGNLRSGEERRRAGWKPAVRRGGEKSRLEACDPRKGVPGKALAREAEGLTRRIPISKPCRIALETGILPGSDSRFLA